MAVGICHKTARGRSGGTLPAGGVSGPRGALDLAGSVGRELLEETGLEIGTLMAEPGWSLVRDSSFVALMKGLTARQNAEELRSHIMRHLASAAQPEFSDIASCVGAPISTRECRASSLHILKPCGANNSGADQREAEMLRRPRSLSQ